MKWDAGHTDDDQDTDGHDSGHHSPASTDSHFEMAMTGTKFTFKLKHRVSCHRCGNMRKHRRECIRCPHVYCHQCEIKMVEEFGANIFKDGCPVCKELCCCGKNRSFTCPRQHHCYKKCPSTKRHSYKTATGFVTASKRCMKNRFAIHECVTSHVGDCHSHGEGMDSTHDDVKLSMDKQDALADHVRRSARISQLYSRNKRMTCYAEDFSDEQSDHEHTDPHDSDGETSCAGSDFAEHHSSESEQPVKCMKRSSSSEDLDHQSEPSKKVLRVADLDTSSGIMHSISSLPAVDSNADIAVPTEQNEMLVQDKQLCDPCDILEIDMLALFDNFLIPDIGPDELEFDEAFFQSVL